jgi:hypothetical protein
MAASTDIILKTQISHSVSSAKKSKPFKDGWFVSEPLRLYKGEEEIQDEFLSEEELADIKGNGMDYHHFYRDMGWLGLGAYT